MKKRAFTLTELLVVVVIIATLSAVVLPKFTKVLETRKTTEAESILQAVRAEQEARCTLDKNYTTEKSELATYPQNGAKNYDFVFDETGMVASAKGKAYSLRIKSYADGGICCEGDYCANLNKHYPTCESYAPAKSGVECAAGGGSTPEPEPTCTKPSTKTESCPEGYIGTGIKYTLDPDTCNYVKTAEDCVQKVCEEGATRNDVSTCTNHTWEQCEGNKWVSKSENITSTDCRQGCGKPSKTQTCSDGKTVQTAQYSCNQSTGKWQFTGWDPATCPNTCPASADPQHCDNPQSETAVPGIWYDYPDCECVCPSGSELSSFGECEKIPCKQADIDACSAAGGNFNNDTCTCACPSKKHMENGICVCSAAARSACAGTWHESSCTCTGASLNCSWEITGGGTIPSGLLCGAVQDGESCGDNTNGSSSRIAGRPECTIERNGQTFNSCVYQDACPGGGILKDEQIYTCKCM